MFLETSVMLIARSGCLTKNYCSKDCLLSDQAAHTVCCKLPRSMDNVDQRKVKKDGRARAEEANKSLENYKRRGLAKLPRAVFYNSGPRAGVFDAFCRKDKVLR